MCVLCSVFSLCQDNFPCFYALPKIPEHCTKKNEKRNLFNFVNWVGIMNIVEVITDSSNREVPIFYPDQESNVFMWHDWFFQSGRKTYSF